MGAGASVAHELSLPAINNNNLHHVGKSVGGTKPRGGQYGEMLVHLRLVSAAPVPGVCFMYCTGEANCKLLRSDEN